MKSNYLLKQLNHLTPWTAIVREQKQFIQIAFAVHLSAVISAERYRSNSGALKSAVLHFVFFMIIINKMQQSAAQRCLKSILSEVFLLTVGSGKTMAFENRRGKYKELGKKVPQAYWVYVEDTFLPCDAVIARIFSKEMTHTDNQGDNEEQKAKRYYYHSDHLGSAQFVTDWKGRQYENIEYTPYGELWTYKSKTAMLFLTTYNNFLAKQPAGLIEEVAAGLDKLPFRFTGKELDEETGLYYYGARYLDPKYSRWLSGDPALNDYMAGSSVGKGGIYNTVNFNVYHYGGNNPIKYIDPTGMYTEDEIENFKKSSAKKQLEFLKNEYDSVKVSPSNQLRGEKSKEMRTLKDSMKLDGLFKADETFMNETLHDFLNLKEDGTMNYSLDELMDPNSGWSEVSSIESQYHQTNAEKPNLNAKFIHQDGREVVINSKEMVVLDYPDKGTFNYVNGSIINPLTWRGHSLYDIKPYEKLITHNVLITSNKSYWFGYNTSRWMLDKE